jgi:hypothetical protein
MINYNFPFKQTWYFPWQAVSRPMPRVTVITCEQTKSHSTGGRINWAGPTLAIHNGSDALLRP